MGAVAFLSACNGDIPVAPAPLAPGNVQAADRSPASGAENSVGLLGSATGICLTATLTADGQYLAKRIAIALPAGVDAGSRGLARFAYRGWASGMQMPARLAICNIPDSPASRERFSQLFDASVMTSAQLKEKGRAAQMSRADEWAPGDPLVASPGTPPVYLVDGLVRNPLDKRLPGGKPGDVSIMSCDPVTLQCPEPTDPYCDPNVDPTCGGATQDPPSSYPAPSYSLQPGTTLDPYTGASLYSASSGGWQCVGTTWKPYRQFDIPGTVNYDYIETRSSWTCSGSLLRFKVWTNLQKYYSFFGWIRFWGTVTEGSVVNGFGSGQTATSVASIACVQGGTGYWRGNGFLQVTDYFQIWPTRPVTTNKEYFTCVTA